MKKALLFSTIMVSLFAINATAQQKYSVSFGGGYSSYKATGNTKTSNGLGLDITAKAMLSENVEAFAQTGYNAYLNNGFNLAFIPMLVGANVHINNLKPGIGIGYGSSTAGGSTKGGFTVSPQLTYSFKNVDFVAHYTSTKVNSSSTWNMFGFKLLHKLF